MYGSVSNRVYVMYNKLSERSHFAGQAFRFNMPCWIYWRLILTSLFINKYERRLLMKNRDAFVKMLSNRNSVIIINSCGENRCGNKHTHFTHL